MREKKNWATCAAAECSSSAQQRHAAQWDEKKQKLQKLQRGFPVNHTLVFFARVVEARLRLRRKKKYRSPCPWMYRIPIHTWGPPELVHVSVLRAASDKKGPEGEHEAGSREHVQHEEHQVVACKDSEQSRC